MNDFSKIIVHNFDHDNRIMHVTIKELLVIADEEEFVEFWKYNFSSLAKYASKDDRIYLIIDIHNLIIEPQLVNMYAKHIQKMYKKFIFKDGIARYGSQLTRVTIMLGHKEFLRTEPNLFRTKEEAFDFIHQKIKESTQKIKSISK